MKGLLQDLKENTIKQVYLLYGEEDYLRKQYRDRLKEKLVSPDDTMNYSYYEGKNISVGEVVDLAETLPFFADRRVIFLENSGFVKKGGEQLAEYVKDMAQFTTLVLIETEVDKRAKLFKAIKDKGRVCEFSIQDESTLKRWILSILKKENKKITEYTLAKLIDTVGTDMENIRIELEKLICYTMGKEEITSEDLDQICIHRVSNQIFEMINAVADRKQKRALELYNDLLALKEPPMKILSLIGRQFHLLYQVKLLKMQGYQDKQIGEKVGLHGFVVGKYVKQSGSFKAEELRRAVEACVDAEECVKTGRMNDKTSVELLLVQFTV